MNIIKTLIANNIVAHNIISDFKGKTEQFYSEYISHSKEVEYGLLWDETYNEIKRIKLWIFSIIAIEVWKFRIAYRKDRSSLHNKVDLWNNIFVKEEKLRCKELFASIDGKALDDQQQTAVVTDEDHNLIIAGAGSGKTLTISAKVKYLCDVKNIKSDEILLLSFTKKAADEMSDRIHNKLGIGVDASTFHRFGLHIISEASNERPDVNDAMENIIKEYFRNIIVEDSKMVRLLVEFFGYYIDIPSVAADFDSLGDCFDHERGHDFDTVRHKMGKDVFVSQIKTARGLKTISIKGEKMKSRQETMIANYLFLNGVNYIYEPLYEYLDGTDKMRKRYRPDFYLPDYDIYLEHFGINKENRAPWLDEIEEQKYIDSIAWKRQLHQSNGTKLIETYSYYISEGILFSEIDKQFKKYNVVYSEPDYLEIFNTAYGSVEEKYFLQFIQLCSTFIKLFKSNGYSIEELRLLKLKSIEGDTLFHQKRREIFIDIIEPLINYYSETLAENNQIDFSDMINKATEEILADKLRLNYKYVIIDEYQDISMARYKLVKAVIEQTGAKLFCVGDDWQSIYRFAGSDINLFTKFDKYFGYTKTLYIEKTYRNSQQLINQTSKFIMMNKSQKDKHLRSDKNLDEPLVFIDTLYKNTKEERFNIIDEIIEKSGPEHSIMFLGRTNHDLDKLQILPDISIKRNQDGIVTIDYEKSPETKITFLTVHKSKGLEADNVILLNFNNELLGFPNKIADDPLVEMVLSDPEQYPYAEERRLLYVALTRTKNYCYVLVDKIISEFGKDFDAEVIKMSHVKCPRCETGNLTKRVAKRAFGNHEFLGCSNYPQCDYTIDDITVLENQVRCEYCDGFMIKKYKYKYDRVCSNYPYCDGKGNKKPGADNKKMSPVYYPTGSFGENWAKQDDEELPFN